MSKRSATGKSAGREGVFRRNPVGIFLRPGLVYGRICHKLSQAIVESYRTGKKLFLLFVCAVACTRRIFCFQILKN